MPSVSVVLLILTVWNALPWLVLGSLFASVFPSGWLGMLPVAVAVFLPVFVLLRSFGGRAYPSALTRLLVLRPFWYAQLFLPLLAIAGLIGTLFGLPFGIPGDAGRWVVGGMGAILLLAAIWGYAGTQRLVVRALDVRFRDLPVGLDGMRIVQLSDLHVGPHTSRRHLTRIAEAVRQADPDIIALTGDQVDDYPRDVEPLGAVLGGLHAPLGVFAIAGNHDVYAGWESVRRGMERIGWKVLVNEAILIERRDAQFWLAGTGDPAGGRPGTSAVAPDIGRTLARVPPDAFVITLAHNPALWPDLAARNVALTLSGHTHYGQFAIPSLQWSLASPFLELAMGLHRRAGSVLYINPGTNYWGLPLRIGTLPEVTVITLRRN
jgi:predicted MPP superfamily phosphohydrolase